jgi:hypothetical protein
MDDIFPHDGSFSARGGPLAAVVLCRTPHGNLHAGLLFKVHGEPHVLHLGWEDQLRNHWDLGGLWTAPEVQPEHLFVLARMCRMVWRRFESERKLPYALGYMGTTFDSDGRLVLASGARGVTCATFILAVLGSVGIELVDEPTWPVREDEDRAFIESVRGFATPSLLAVLEDEVDQGVRRIRPDEVMAACRLDLPARFPDTRALADEIVALLDTPTP